MKRSQLAKIVLGSTLTSATLLASSVAGTMRCAAGKCGAGKCGAAPTQEETKQMNEAIQKAGESEVSGSFAFTKSGPAGRSAEVTYMSRKKLVVGNNPIAIEIKDKKGNPIENATVEMKVFMPEMPGMPYMEYKDASKYIQDGKYFTLMNFSMAGTWQVRIYITTKDGQKLLHKSSVIL